MSDTKRIGRPPTPARDRLLALVEIDEATGCWLWMGSRKGPGYGTFCFENVTRLAHRVSYELFVGPIPEGLQVDHLCNTPPCVRPDHLEVCSGRQNVLRSPAAPSAINARKTHCNNGHEFTPENTYVTKNGSRQCKRCTADRMKRAYWRQKQESA